MAVVRYSIIVCIFLVSFVRGGKHDQYSRFSVHGIQLRSAEDQQVLQDLRTKLNIDIWQEGSPGRRDALVMVSPSFSDMFLEQMDSRGIGHYLYLRDVASALDEHDGQITKWRQSRNDRMLFQDYPSYEEVDTYLERIAASHPSLVTIATGGTSWEGRDIKYLKISSSNFTDQSKPVYLLTAMLHAREWVTTPVTLYSIYRLVENLRAEDRDLLEETDWIVMPLVNPDGYEFSRAVDGDRLWRKTRSFRSEVHQECYGVDANRNFNVSFNTAGVSDNPCNLVYPGPSPFSEPETQAVDDVISEHLSRIQIYMDVHSHGNYVLFGYGNYSLPPNAAHLHLVAAKFGAVTDALKLPQAGYYLIGNSASLLYPSSGSSQDYGQLAGIPFSYTLELPGYGFDFRVPPEFIDQINEETWQGIAATARLSVQYYRARYNALT